MGGRLRLTERRRSAEPVTLAELGQVSTVGRKRIRQTEVRAFEKLQARMRAMMAR